MTIFKSLATNNGISTIFFISLLSFDHSAR